MGVDVIWVSLSRESSDLEHFQKHALAGIPIAYFNKLLPGTTTDKVVIPGYATTIWR
jgi:hypothetical protein